MIAFSLTNIKDFNVAPSVKMKHLIIFHLSKERSQHSIHFTLTALSKKSSLTLTPSFPNTLIGKM